MSEGRTWMVEFEREGASTRRCVFAAGEDEAVGMAWREVGTAHGWQLRAAWKVFG